MKLKNSINVNTVSVGTTPLLPISQALLGQRGDYIAPFDPASFNQAWTVTGKTNEDEDRATIANITGNGNNLQLKNFAFSGSSGYGLYDIPSPTTWPYYGVTKVNLTQYSVQLTDRSYVNQDLLIFFENGSSLLVAGTYNFTGFRFKITNPNNHPLSAFFRGDKSLWNIDVTESGIYEFPDITLTLEEDANTNFGFELATDKEIENFSIIFELLPKYAGYLVTDGVDDRIVSSPFTLNKNWTVVGNWKMLQPEANKLAGIIKQNSLYICNYVEGLQVSINAAYPEFKLKGIRSVNAICSDGRIYLNDWTEIIYLNQQTVDKSTGALVIGVLGSAYTSSAFKNLAFYKDIVLTKEEAQLAYKYLQTL